MENKSCKTCKWAQWQRNKVGARMFWNGKKPGKCLNPEGFHDSKLHGHSGMNCHYWEKGAKNDRK